MKIKIPVKEACLPTTTEGDTIPKFDGVFIFLYNEFALDPLVKIGCFRMFSDPAPSVTTIGYIRHIGIIITSGSPMIFSATYGSIEGGIFAF